MEIVQNGIMSLEVTDSAGSPKVLDFNRFYYLGVPTPKDIRNVGGTRISRSFVGKLFSAIKALHEEDAPGATLCNHFNAARRHVIFCDERQLEPFTALSIQTQVYDLHDQQRRGKINDKTETCRRGDISALLQIMGFPHREWLPKTVLSGTTQQQSAKGYTPAELKRMLPLLRAMFKQFSIQYQENPTAFDGRGCNSLGAKRARMNFTWQGTIYTVYGPVSKMFAAAVYLLSYYTWANTSVLFSLQRPTQATFTQSETWYQMPAFKRRAFKSVTVSMGGGSSVEVPKYALSFFDELIKVSTLFWGTDSELLFGSVGNTRCPINSHTLKGLCSYIDETFHLQDDRGQLLRPRIGRFRATGGEMMIAQQGVMTAALMLDNTPNTVRARYSSGNPSQNNQMLSDATNVLYHAVKNPGDIASAKSAFAEAQGVEVLTYESYLQSVRLPSRTAHGGYCKQDDSMDDIYTRKSLKRGLVSEGERLACADLKSCFSCQHQVLVESVDDIWCLLSFKECIEESLYLHDSVSHFVKNYSELLGRIESRTLKISKKILRLAEQKLIDDGRHPLWMDASDLGGIS